MPGTLQLLLDGAPVSDDVLARLDTLEVEESVDLPGAIQLTLPVSRSNDGDLAPINDDALQPFANLAVVVAGDDGLPECIFDGYVLSQQIHLEPGATASTLKVWGQDASWLMNLEETVKEWAGLTDGGIANQVFGVYGITPAPENLQDDSPPRTEDGATVMQRSTDIQFLRLLGKRGGKFVRVACGPVPGARTGHFARPNLAAAPSAALELHDTEGWNTSSLDISWDVTRPAEVAARQALFTSNEKEGVSGDTSDAGLALLDERNLAAFAGKTVKTQLTAHAVDTADLQMRARALLTDANWFVQCSGQADAARLKKILRAGTVVEVGGAGSVHSGKYFVWSVRHTLTATSHRMAFVLARNAVGPKPSGGLSGGGGF